MRAGAVAAPSTATSAFDSILAAQPSRATAAGHPLAAIPYTTVGGLRLAAIDRRQTAELMLDLAVARRGAGGRPYVLSSANGEVISRCASEPHVAALFAESDLVSADGQPLVLASRLLGKTPLPERVATTDLFHDFAQHPLSRSTTSYLFGATDEENRRAVARVRSLYPHLPIVGHSHGYLVGAALDRKIAEIDALKPDVLWVALGVPREQEFCRRFAARLGGVGVIKTSGGLFNFLSGTRQRAPQWMQTCGLKWAWRIKEEPRRLFWRYAVTNPHALLLLMTRSA